MNPKTTNTYVEPNRHPTVWGLSPQELHDRFWASRGIQVVRPCESSEIVEKAELFLLINPSFLVIFRLRLLIDQLSWLEPDLMWVRVHDTKERGYREKAIADSEGRFIRYERTYGGSDARVARIALTPRIETARLWQSAPNVHQGWQRIRRQIPSIHRTVVNIQGHTYLRNADHEVMQFLRDLIETWVRPDTTIDRISRLQSGVWIDTDAEVSSNTTFIGPAWIGADRKLASGTSVIGPALLWDDPTAQPVADRVKWDNLEPTQAFRPIPKPRNQSPFERRIKRIFDLVTALFALLITLPIFPLVILAIWLEDGRPFFFAHHRETIGEKTFPCLKFRSMRKDAEEIKARLSKQNQADGPQFFVENDPRLTRVGKFIRKVHIDELPQFLNVLAGHMSIVGPRPSPYEENQYSPSWREARLSVRPGVTGLWQVKRTRQKGLDFQEWIKYDLEYVENRAFWLDIWIIWKTVQQILKKDNQS